MGFLDTPSPNPRTVEYYMGQYRHYMGLAFDAHSKGYNANYCNTLVETAEWFKERADNLALINLKLMETAIAESTCEN